MSSRFQKIPYNLCMYAYKMKQSKLNLQCFIFPRIFFFLGKILEKLAEDNKENWEGNMWPGKW